MPQQKTILLFYNHLSSFIKKDVEILSAEFEVRQHDFYPQSKFDTLFKFISQFFFLLKNITSTDLIVCQFASYHSLLPSLFSKLSGKPCLIIVGGTDAHYYPGIGYGNWQKTILKTATALSFQWCSHIAPKHASLMRSENLYDEKEPKQQGIYARLPELTTPFTEITNGYDSVKWHCAKQKREKTFITVCSGWEFPFQYQLKGIDLIAAVASKFPECEFVVLGVPDEKLIPVKPANLKILPPVKNEALIDILSECEFYLQLSIAEGFPNSLCEAMLCECVPIGSAVFSIPEIIGDSGFVSKHRDELRLQSVIQTALHSDSNYLGKKARQRIAENYSLDLRKEKLLGFCKQLMN